MLVIVIAECLDQLLRARIQLKWLQNIHITCLTVIVVVTIASEQAGPASSSIIISNSEMERCWTDGERRIKVSDTNDTDLVRVGGKVTPRPWRFTHRDTTLVTMTKTSRPPGVSGMYYCGENS